MIQKAMLVSLLISHVSFSDDKCKEAVDAYEKSIEQYELTITKQDSLINNLREQRNEALKPQGSFLTDFIVPALIGGAVATIVIGIRR